MRGGLSKETQRFTETRSRGGSGRDWRDDAVRGDNEPTEESWEFERTGVKK